MDLSRRHMLMVGAGAGAFLVAGCDNNTGNAQAGDKSTVNTADNETPTEYAPTGDLMKPLAFEDRFIGNEDAKVTVIEYSSPTCSHCGNFHNNVYPQFKEQYIDSGKIRFVVRPFVRNILDAVVYMLAASQEEGVNVDYYEILKVYFASQRTWASSETPRDAIAEIALNNGFTQETFDASLTNQALFKELELLRTQAIEEFNLSATPSFFVNGKLIEGVVPLENWAKEIDPLL